MSDESSTEYSDTSATEPESDHIKPEPKVSYSTDYHVNYFENSQKMKPREKRTPYFNKNAVIHEEEEEESENIDDYLKAEDNKQSEKSTNPTNPKPNIFNQPQTYASQNEAINGNNKIFNKLSEDEDEDDDYDSLPPNKQLKRRLEIIRDLGELARDRGITLTQVYNLNSNYHMMKYEYNLYKDIVDKNEFINYATTGLQLCVGGIESLNKDYNKIFNLRLDGWSDSIASDMDNFRSIFGDFYKKWNKPGKNTSPEMRLVMALAFGGINYHFKNTDGNGDGNGSNGSNKYYQKIPSHENEAELIFKREEEMRRKRAQEYEDATKQVKSMAALNEINNRNEKLKSDEQMLQNKRMQLEKDREEFERFKKMQNANKHEMMGGSKYNETFYNSREQDIEKQLNHLKNNIRENVVPSYDPRSDFPVNPNLKPRSQNSSNNSKTKSNISGAKSTYSKRGTKKGGFKVPL